MIIEESSGQIYIFKGAKEMQELKTELQLKNDPVAIYMEDEDKKVHNTYHHFEFRDRESGEVLAKINYQKGPRKEAGSIPGINTTHVVLAEIVRLEALQMSDYRCRENALSITALQEAVMWQNKRTRERQARRVEGLNKV